VIAARAEAFDLIIIGTSGTQDYYHLFFGSNAYRVVKEASVPVVLLPPGAGYQDISTLVLAFDYWGAKGIPLAQLAKWAKVLESTVRVLQVVKKSYTRELELNLQAMQTAVRETYRDLPLQFDLVYSDEVGESIHEYMVSHKADMLALCSVHHGFAEKVFHKSVIKSVASRAQYPIFIFHDL
jgi:nucleotide-binding universal stress UspA family protein